METRAIAWMLAEFETPEALARAARRLVEIGVRRIDAYSPYPLAEIDRALRIPRSTIPRWVLPAGTAGALLGFGVQWWCNGWDYPLNVGARPLLSAPAFIPITFETTVLLASITAFVVFFVKARLPEPSHPLFEVPGFESATVDRFWLSIETSDPFYDPTSTKKTLEEHGAVRVVVKEGVP
jgi:hypothetical protein